MFHNAHILSTINFLEDLLSDMEEQYLGTESTPPVQKLNQKSLYEMRCCWELLLLKLENLYDSVSNDVD